MATESPIRISEGTQKWPALNQSTQYGPSSSKIIFEDLDLFIKGQRIQSLEKDVPSRSESAPPSMEGSLEAVENLFSKQKSTLNPRVVYPSISVINRENELQLYDDSSPSSYHSSAVVLDQKFRTHPFDTSGRTRSDWKMSPHAKSADGSVRMSWNSLPAHKEESEDDGWSEQNASLAFEKDDPSSDVRRQTVHERGLNAVNIDVQDNISTAGASIEARNSFDVTTAPNSDTDKSRKKEQPVPPNSMLQNQVVPKESNHSRGDGSYSQIIYPGISNSYGGLNHLYYGSPSVPVTEGQPILQSPGFTPPFYAPAAAFMTSTSQFYPNLQPSGVFTQQYSISGYALNSAVLPSYLPGFPHQGVVPMAFGRAPFPTSGASDGGNLHAYNMQNLKFSNQLGAPLQQYLPVPVPDLYGTYGHFGHQPPGVGAVANQVGSCDLKKSADLRLLNDHTSQPSDSAGYNSSNPRGGNISIHYSFESPTNVGSLMRFPTPSAVSPGVPAKPLGGTYSHGGRHNASHVHSSGNSRKTSGTQNQSWNHTNAYSFLEELKSGNGQRFDLSVILGHIGDFSADQHGSRFIQQKLESCSVEEKASVFKEILPNASKLTTDVFGNYVIQKPGAKKRPWNQLAGHILTFSLQMYGCRVIQKAIEVIDLEQKTRLVKELDGHVMRCVRDQNGNHVIQKCIERIPIDNIHFIIASFHGQVATLSTHPYGCRVIQRVLEHGKDESQTQFIVDEILDSVCSLAQDQYGNYVTQHVLERGKPRERSEIIKKLSGSIVQLSQHKFASNVIEKCLEYTDSPSRGILIKEIVGDGNTNDNLLVMIKDQYANYVMQRILQKCTSDQREMLLGQIRNHLHVLKKYTYGKHIVARFEKLYGEDIKTSES